MVMIPSEELSQALKRKRNKMGKTQQRISDLSELSVAQISRIENNDTNYSHENAYRLWETLKQLEEDLETVEEVMKPSISWAKPEETVLEVKKEMRKNDYSQLPVKQDGEHNGRINSTRLLNANSPEEKIEKYTGPSYSVVGPKTPVSSISKIVKQDSAIIVKENGKYIGLVTRADIL